MPETCPGPECTRRVFCKGLCQTHYKQMRDRGYMKPVMSQFARKAPGSICQIEGCGRTENGRGMCNMHATRLRKYGHTDSIAPIRFKICVISGCALPSRGNSLCSSHYARAFHYSLTDIQLNQLLLITECQACGSADGLSIDHDHACCPGVRSCGRCNRGVLCRGCNTALGSLNDSRDRMKALLAYLDSCES